MFQELESVHLIAHQLRNTIVTAGRAVRISNPDDNHEQIVAGNAIFAGTAFSLDTNVTEYNNFTGTNMGDAENYLASPFASLEDLDMSPIGDLLNKEELELTLDFPGIEQDYNGRVLDNPTFGAVVADQRADDNHIEQQIP